MPNYVVEAHCKLAAAASGTPSQATLNDCVHREQSAYDHLKPDWDSLPAAMRSECDRVAVTSDAGSYVVLRGCVRMLRWFGGEPL
jgi:hypothetical protein